MHGWNHIVSKDARVIHLINQFISLKDEDIRRNNKILKEVLDEVIQFLKAKDPFFRDYYEKIVFAGSYYKGTKVGNPDEFDLNLVIRLPVRYESIQFEQDLPGFTKLRLCDDSFLPKWNDHKKLLTKWTSKMDSLSDTLINSFFDYNYLRPDKFRQWMESLFSNIPTYSNAGYQLKVSKSGPAFTLTVYGLDLSSDINVDLVPVMEFRNDISLKRVGVDVYGNWYAVPKPLEINAKLPDVQWRISFYTEERKIMKLYKNGYLKPVIRQMKKLRDKYQWNFASYYIETIFLTEMRYRSYVDLVTMGEIQLFVYMLTVLREACEFHEILNYWDSGHNLIAHLSKAQLDNMKGQLTRIIQQITADPLSIASSILTTDEFQKIQGRVDAIRNGEAFAPISNEPLKLEENTSWCSIQ